MLNWARSRNDWWLVFGCVGFMIACLILLVNNSVILSLVCEIMALPFVICLWIRERSRWVRGYYKS